MKVFMHLQAWDATIKLMQNYTECIIYRKTNLLFLKGKKSNCTLYPNTIITIAATVNYQYLYTTLLYARCYCKYFKYY